MGTAFPADFPGRDITGTSPGPQIKSPEPGCPRNSLMHSSWAPTRPMASRTSPSGRRWYPCRAAAPAWASHKGIAWTKGAGQTARHTAGNRRRQSRAHHSQSPRVPSCGMSSPGTSTPPTDSRSGSSCGGRRSPAGTSPMTCGPGGGASPAATSSLTLTGSSVRAATPPRRRASPASRSGYWRSPRRLALGVVRPSQVLEQVAQARELAGAFFSTGVGERSEGAGG